MGFWQKLRNLVTKFKWKEDAEILAEEAQKKKPKQPDSTPEPEEEIVIEPPKPEPVQEEPKKEEVEAETERKKQVKTAKETTEKLQPTPEDKPKDAAPIYEEAAKERLGETSREPEEIHQKMSKYEIKRQDIENKIDAATAQYMGVDTEFDGSETLDGSGSKLIATIIGSKVDAEIADMIVKNISEFRHRFTTEVVFHTSDGIHSLNLIGALPFKVPGDTLQMSLAEAMNQEFNPILNTEIEGYHLEEKMNIVFQNLGIPNDNKSRIQPGFDIGQTTTLYQITYKLKFR